MDGTTLRRVFVLAGPLSLFLLHIMLLSGHTAAGVAASAACEARSCNEQALGPNKCGGDCYLYDAGRNCEHFAVHVMCYIEDLDEWVNLPQGRDGNCGGPIIAE